MNAAEARRLLSVDPSASRDELRRAYREALKIWHPDRALHGSTSAADAHEKAQRINAAYAMLAGECVPDSVAVSRGSSARTRPVRTIDSDWWPLRIITSERASIPAGVLLFGLVWVVLAGLAGAFETFVLS